MSDFNGQPKSTGQKSLGLKATISQALLLSCLVACNNPIARPVLTIRADAQSEGASNPAETKTGTGSSQDSKAGTLPKAGPADTTATQTPATPSTPTPSAMPSTPSIPSVPNDGTPAIGSVDAGGWKLVWSDEFNATELDETKWTYEVQRPHWVNDELQGYTDRRKENVRLEDGHLVLEARKDNFNGQEYTSGRIKTQGKHSWKYGRIEASIKLPGGLGTWPAFWMMPENQSRGWPACGEIDIMEEVGYDQDVSVATTHTFNYNWANNNVKTASTKVDGITTGYHTYAAEWYPDHIDMFVDGRKYYTVTNEGNDNAWPFDKNFHIILNLAIGGVWGGIKGVDANIWPRAMLVDWVRVYQK